MCVAASKLATLWHKNLENLSSSGPPNASPIVSYCLGTFLFPLRPAFRIWHHGSASHLGGHCLDRPSWCPGLRAWTRRQDAGTSSVGCSQARPTFIGLATRPAAALPSQSLSPGHGRHLSSGNVQVALHRPWTLRAPGGTEWQLLRPLCRPVVKFLGFLTN